MKWVLQIVRDVELSVDKKIISKIDKGLVAYFCVEKDDKEKDLHYFAKRISELRIFPDENDKMNLSLIDIKGEMLIVSQFTLCGDCKKGTRPSFDKSAPPAIANELYEKFVAEIKTYNIQIATGVFGAMMDVKLINDGPVTFMIEI